MTGAAHRTTAIHWRKQTCMPEKSLPNPGATVARAGVNSVNRGHMMLALFHPHTRAHSSRAGAPVHFGISRERTGALARVGTRRTMNAASLSGHALAADSDYPRLKNYLIANTGLAYYVDKDEQLAGHVAK